MINVASRIAFASMYREKILLETAVLISTERAVFRQVISVISFNLFLVVWAAASAVLAQELQDAKVPHKILTAFTLNPRRMKKLL